MEIYMDCPEIPGFRVACEDYLEGSKDPNISYALYQPYKLFSTNEEGATVRIRDKQMRYGSWHFNENGQPERVEDGE